jgi:hypothetical protein
MRRDRGDDENQRNIRHAELRRLVEEGRKSGLSSVDGNVMLDRLEKKYRALVRRHRA